MKALKVAGLTAIAYLSKLLVSLFIIKEISLTHGPAGLGLFGNFMTLVSLASTLAGGGILSGVIKYLAEYTGLLARQASFAGSALVYSLFFALLVLGIGVYFVDAISLAIFMKPNYQTYIYFFLLGQLFVSLSNFSFSVANGLGKNNLYTLFLFIGNLIAFIVAFYGIHYFGTWGAVVAIMAPTIFPVIPALCYALSQRLFKQIRFNMVLSDARLLSKFSAMRFFSVLCMPVVEIMITNQIKQSLGLESAGLWQAVTKLSMAYLSFYTMFLTFYFLPLVSSLLPKKQIVKEVNKMMAVIGSSFALMIIVFWIFKDLIIRLVLSEQFLPMADLMGLQMIGDFFKLLGSIIGFVVVSKAALKWYLLGEAFQGILFVGLSHYLLSYFSGLQGVVGAYVLTCVAYCLLSVILFFYFFSEKSHSIEAVNY